MFDAIFHFVYELFYRIDCFFCLIVNYEYKMFEVFAGMKKVSYDGGKNYDYLINIFFGQENIKTIYWAMALVGIVMSFGFTIYAVIKKMFDIDDKVKEGFGGIIGNQGKSIFTILLLNFIIMIVLQGSSVLLNTIQYTFNNSSILTTGTEIEFDESDYATMARILNTIGNYSLNPSRDSTYNINTCYNEIQPDLKMLSKKHMFSFNYLNWEIDNNLTNEDNEEGYYEIVYKETVPNWQMVITKIGLAHSLNKQLPIDEYDEKVRDALINAMEVMSTTYNFYPLERYASSAEPITADGAQMDAILFLGGTLNAAKNEEFNVKPSMFDGLRYDYVRKHGKDIYDLDTIEEDFDISFSGLNHLQIIITGFLVARILLTIIMNCIARIFNMLILYLIAPPFIGMSPLDNGEKTRQWTTAFIVQAFGVFGSVIGMRLLMMVLTVIFSSDLILFESAVLNYLGKIIMLWAIAHTVSEASKMVNGILANNASMQSLSAGDAGARATQSFRSAALRAGKAAFGAAATVSGARMIGNRVASGVKNSTIGNALRNWGGGGASSMKALDEKAAQSRAKSQAQESEAKQLRNDIKKGGKLGEEQKQKLAGMSATDARDKLGLGEGDFDSFKNDVKKDLQKNEVNQLRKDIKKGGPKADELKQNLANMPASEAQEKYGLNEKKFNALKKEFGVDGAKKEPPKSANIQPPKSEDVTTRKRSNSAPQRNVPPKI